MYIRRNNLTVRRKHRQEEHDLQCACIRWFRMQYPKLRHCLFAVPNGGKRDEVTAAQMKAEGTLAGVSDLILLKSNAHYGALLIEMKTPKGRQSEHQKAWQLAIEPEGYKYVICRSVDDFIREVKDYFSNT